MSFGLWACPSPSLTASGRFGVSKGLNLNRRAAVASASPQGWAGLPQTLRGELSNPHGGSEERDGDDQPSQGGGPALQLAVPISRRKVTREPFQGRNHLARVYSPFRCVPPQPDL